MNRLQPWASDVLVSGEIKWVYRQMDAWQVEMIAKQISKYKKLFVKWVKGFTLVELMIAVAIIGILSTIATVSIRESIRRSQEATTKSHLATLRKAVLLYRAEYGTYPARLEDVTVMGDKIIKEIPYAWTPPYHPRRNTVENLTSGDRMICSSGWFYNAKPNDQNFGQVFVNCEHLDIKNIVWEAH